MVCWGSFHHATYVCLVPGNRVSSHCQWVVPRHLYMVLDLGAVLPAAIWFKLVLTACHARATARGQWWSQLAAVPDCCHLWGGQCPAASSALLRPPSGLNSLHRRPQRHAWERLPAPRCVLSCSGEGSPSCRKIPGRGQWGEGGGRRQREWCLP